MISIQFYKLRFEDILTKKTSDEFIKSIQEDNVDSFLVLLEEYRYDFFPETLNKIKYGDTDALKVLLSVIGFYGAVRIYKRLFSLEENCFRKSYLLQGANMAFMSNNFELFKFIVLDGVSKSEFFVESFLGTLEVLGDLKRRDRKTFYEFLLVLSNDTEVFDEFRRKTVFNDFV